MGDVHYYPLHNFPDVAGANRFLAYMRELPRIVLGDTTVYVDVGAQVVYAEQDGTDIPLVIGIPLAHGDQLVPSQVAADMLGISAKLVHTTMRDNGMRCWRGGFLLSDVHDVARRRAYRRNKTPA